MARPCGCGGGGVVVRCGQGMACSGVGTSGDPLVIGWQIPLATVACDAVMDCVGSHLGVGLGYAARTITLKLDPDPNNKASLSTAGLMVSGTTPTPDTPGASVAKLLTLPKPVMGGSYGAGNAIWPEGAYYSYEAAVNLLPETLSIVHVPIRRTSELLPVCLDAEYMSRYDAGFGNTPVNVLDQNTMDRIVLKPSQDPPTASSGYFGFYQRVSQSVPTLGMLFNLLANKTVIYAETKDKNTPKDTADRLMRMLPSWNVSKSLIAAGEPVAALGEYPTILHAVLAARDQASPGLPVCAHLTTPDQVRTYTGTVLKDLGCQWVALTYEAMDDESPAFVAGAIAGYKAAGLEILSFTCHRQYHYDLAVKNDIRGILCSDPIYVTGKYSRYRYRRDEMSLDWASPTYGLHSPWSGTDIDHLSSAYRGYVRNGQGLQLVINQQLWNPGASPAWDYSGYWLLQGEMGPLRNATRYAVNMWCWWDKQVTDRGRWIGMWLDRPTDRPLFDWASATRHTIGYLLSLNQSGDLILTEYDGTPAPGNGTPPSTMKTRIRVASGYSIAARNFYGFRAEVDGTQIRIYRTNTDPFGPRPFPKTLVATWNNANRYISGTDNGYIFMARHFFELSDPYSCETRLVRPMVSYTDF